MSCKIAEVHSCGILKAFNSLNNNFAKKMFMKSISRLLVFISVIVISSCAKKSGNYIASFSNDMDASFAWSDAIPPNVIQNPDAHSGRYICRLDSAYPYSPTYNEKVSNISEKKFSKVKISAWIKVDKNSAEPSLVIDIRDSTGKTLEWIGKNFTGENLKTVGWNYYENIVDLKEGSRLTPSNIYRIYVMNDKSNFVLLDDLEINYY